jgi:transposase-like protein
VPFQFIKFELQKTKFSKKGDSTMSTKLNASAQKNKLFEEIIRMEGIGGGGDIFREFFKRGMEKLLQESLESEVTDFLGRSWYEHNGSEGKTKGYRNGYYDRQVKTSEGLLELRQPRLRQTEEEFRSRILERLDSLEDNLRYLSREMYIRGLSTRDIEDTFRDESGEALLSRSSVSRLNSEMIKEYEEFISRDLSELDVVYLFVDGVYEAVRRFTGNRALLCAWGICSDGTKRLIHIAAVESESQVSWEMFFDDMTSRGLRHPLLVVSDGGKGATCAIVKSFPRADRQRCLAHKLRNIASKLPKDRQAEVLSTIKGVYYAADHQAAKILASDFIDKNIDNYPSAVKCFSEDLEACLVNLKYPLGHRKFIRTTNLLERAFEEEKRRTKVFPQHANEKALTGLIFSVLYRASQNWKRIGMRDDELKILKNIRKLMTNEDSNGDYISYKLVA